MTEAVGVHACREGCVLVFGFGGVDGQIGALGGVDRHGVVAVGVIFIGLAGDGVVAEHGQVVVVDEQRVDSALGDDGLGADAVGVDGRCGHGRQWLQG